MSLPYIPDQEDRDDMSYLVFPTKQTLEFMKDASLIHYKPIEPTYGDRFANPNTPDFQGNAPDRYFREHVRMAVHTTNGSRPASVVSESKPHQIHVMRDSEVNLDVSDVSDKEVNTHSNVVEEEAQVVTTTTHVHRNSTNEALEALDNVLDNDRSRTSSNSSSADEKATRTPLNSPQVHLEHDHPLQHHHQELIDTLDQHHSHEEPQSERLQRRISSSNKYQSSTKQSFAQSTTNHSYSSQHQVNTAQFKVEPRPRQSIRTQQSEVVHQTVHDQTQQVPTTPPRRRRNARQHPVRAESESSPEREPTPVKPERTSRRITRQAHNYVNESKSNAQQRVPFDRPKNNVQNEKQHLEQRKAIIQQINSHSHVAQPVGGTRDRRSIEEIETTRENLVQMQLPRVPMTPDPESVRRKTNFASKRQSSINHHSEGPAAGQQTRPDRRHSSSSSDSSERDHSNSSRDSRRPEMTVQERIRNIRSKSITEEPPREPAPRAKLQDPQFPQKPITKSNTDYVQIGRIRVDEKFTNRQPAPIHGQRQSPQDIYVDQNDQQVRRTTAQIIESTRQHSRSIRNETTQRNEQTHGRSELTHGRSELTHGRSEPTHGRSEPTHGRSEPTHGRSEPTHGRSEPTHGRSEQTHGRSEQTHGRSEQTHGRSEQTHGRSEQTHGRSEQTHGRSEQTHGRSVSFRRPTTEVPTETFPVHQHHVQRRSRSKSSSSDSRSSSSDSSNRRPSVPVREQVRLFTHQTTVDNETGAGDMAPLKPQRAKSLNRIDDWTSERKEVEEELTRLRSNSGLVRDGAHQLTSALSQQDVRDFVDMVGTKIEQHELVDNQRFKSVISAFENGIQLKKQRKNKVEGRVIDVDPNSGRTHQSRDQSTTRDVAIDRFQSAASRTTTKMTQSTRHDEMSSFQESRQHQYSADRSNTSQQFGSAHSHDQHQRSSNPPSQMIRVSKPETVSQSHHRHQDAKLQSQRSDSPAHERQTHHTFHHQQQVSTGHSHDRNSTEVYRQTESYSAAASRPVKEQRQMVSSQGYSTPSSKSITTQVTNNIETQKFVVAPTKSASSSWKTIKNSTLLNQQPVQTTNKPTMASVAQAWKSTTQFKPIEIPVIVKQFQQQQQSADEHHFTQQNVSTTERKQFPGLTPAMREGPSEWVAQQQLVNQVSEMDIPVDVVKPTPVQVTVKSTQIVKEKPRPPPSSTSSSSDSAPVPFVKARAHKTMSMYESNDYRMLTGGSLRSRGVYNPPVYQHHHCHCCHHDCHDHDQYPIDYGTMQRAKSLQRVNYVPATHHRQHEQYEKKEMHRSRSERRIPSKHHHRRHGDTSSFQGRKMITVRDDDDDLIPDEVAEQMAQLHVHITPESVLSQMPTHYENSGNVIPHWQRVLMARKHAEKLIKDQEQELLKKARQ